MLPSGRRVEELGGTTPGKEVPDLGPVETTLRELPSGDADGPEPEAEVPDTQA